jgi:hypothetical protein
MHEDNITTVTSVLLRHVETGMHDDICYRCC